MPSFLLILILLVGIIVTVWFTIFRPGNIGFWKLVSKHPDEAYDWFMSEDCWIVIDSQSKSSAKPEQRDDFTGPFKLFVPKLGARCVTIYGRHDEIEESQKRFMDLYGKGMYKWMEK